MVERGGKDLWGERRRAAVGVAEGEQVSRKWRTCFFTLPSHMAHQYSLRRSIPDEGMDQAGLKK